MIPPITHTRDLAGNGNVQPATLDHTINTGFRINHQHNGLGGLHQIRGLFSCRQSRTRPDHHRLRIWCHTYLAQSLTKQNFITRPWRHINIKHRQTIKDRGRCQRAFARSRRATQKDHTPSHNHPKSLCDPVSHPRFGGIPTQPTTTKPALWAVCRDVSASFDGAFAIGVDVAPNAGSAAIAAAGFRADGVLVIDVIEHHGGLDWLLPRLEQIVKDHKPDVVVIDPRSEAGQLLPDLAKAGIDVLALKTFDVVQACGGFVSLVKAGRLRHLGQDSLDVAVSGVTRRRVGDAWCFSRRDISLDISPLYAVTFAAHALKAAPPPAAVSSIVNLNDYL